MDNLRNYASDEAIDYESGTHPMTRTPEMIAEGWLPHDGGLCPVHPLNWGNVLFRDGDTCECQFGAWTIGNCWWNWKDRQECESDIIAYKPENPNG